MKILVMGGAGDMGSRTVEDLALSAGVERVTIADRNLPASRELAGRLPGSPAEVNALAVDAMDHHGVSPDHLQPCLSRFCRRFSRRHFEGELFDRLLRACITGGDPLTLLNWSGVPQQIRPPPNLPPRWGEGRHPPGLSAGPAT